ncbi:histidine kinase [Daedalea quercina L-15889]|uniref:dolichol kinase n=1 Tax=Daedalea quercina L-15889 TaxID=1314783 RepID=A0A165T8M1_9APHY|nr:histidine kinase [Daedalea quercina L-15889]
MSTVALDWLDAADKHVPTLSLNARRKFFHALAVLMFLPGIAIDPAFSHLAFSAAFALFVFAEYVRYFALYPFGASVHLFMNEFLDQKDCGTAILSHFYLLIGCAGTVWFEGPSQLLQYTGTLVLGVGDALASIAGKRLGRHRWLATSPKTLEGSAAFTVSVVACAWLLRLCGLSEDFSILRYSVVAGLSSALEALSVQNDNVMLPLYMWSMLVFADLRLLVDMMQSPFDPTDDQISTTQSTHEKRDQEGDYDWATFISAYAMGRWDPLRTPSAPRSYLNAPTHSRATRSGSGSILDRPIDEIYGMSSADSLQDGFSVSQSVPSVPSSSPSLPLAEPSKSKRLNVPFSLGAFSHRLRSSFTDLRPSAAGTSYTPSAASDSSRETIIPTTEAATAAAAMRWAAARVSVAPLALPSPEHELTDPMRGVTATIPGSHPQDSPYLTLPSNPPLCSPGTLRKSRLSSFWQGTQDVEDGRLPTIKQSPPEPSESALSSSPEAEEQAPTILEPEEDYFGAEPMRIETLKQAPEPPFASGILDHHPERQVSAPPFDSDPQTVPALPRRICLTRQTSAPLPTQSLYERRMRSARPASESYVSGLTGRAAKEEQMYSELGYLAPPNPPDELERRRALYKFNIWGTGRDLNFDRIVHLVKLVFNTKIVTISLPMVIGDPQIRFYAACPLRTHEGYNIGTLSIIDDTPRREFSPRQRHTLKEFAQVAMRELELWKDKIQLRIRDRIQSSMEQFTRECLDLDREAEGDKGVFAPGTSMEQVYLRAARLVKRTLDVEGAVVLDVSHVDVVETVGSESAMAVTVHNADREAGIATVSKSLSKEEYSRLQEFFAKNPEGKICEGIVPATLRPFLPQRIQYALGVIILSAVLKRRMILADKAKSLFISKCILASAELLADTPLDHSQASFLQTVQACGTSLVETVNHVLDFTKLSGNAKAGGVEHSIHHSRVDLMQLVEEATEGCWIGHRARMFTSEIGSVYSPPKADRSGALSDPSPRHVETVIDIGLSKTGWTFLCEKAGIRRVLMNVFGNSLKFTTDGYVHVMLRQLPSNDDAQKNKAVIELSVIDTGKNQLFHPFSQENPLQTGTGLGLAIVNSIVRSKSVDGKVDVWSAEGVGTEIKITFSADVVEDEHVSASDGELMKVYESLNRPLVSLLGFSDPHRGVQLLRTVTISYLESRWGINVAADDQPGQIVIVNEVLEQIAQAIENKDGSRPFIILSSLRGDPRLMNMVSEYERIGGFCRIVYKPVGPVRLHAALKLCLRILKFGQGAKKKPPLHIRPESLQPITPAPVSDEAVYSTMPRRFSEDTAVQLQRIRPSLGQRAATVHPAASWSHMTSAPEEMDGIEPEPPDSAPSSPRSASSTVNIGTGGTLLKSSVGSLGVRTTLRVLVIEDNSILRNLLIKWLRNKGYDFREAVDGQEGVRIFDTDGHFDVVLVDLSMPVLDGVSATTQMRSIETTRKLANPTSDASGQKSPAARILALTGMSSLEDKRRAFEAGVDGYMVKPVAFKTLDTMFQRLGIVP